MGKAVNQSSEKRRAVRRAFRRLAGQSRFGKREEGLRAFCATRDAAWSGRTMRKLSLLCGSPWRVLSIVVSLLLLFALSEAASDTSSVTFNGSVLMADGVVDPGTVKVYLTQRAEGGEVATRSAYLKVPPGFYKSFRKSSSSNLSGGPGQRQKPRQQGEFKFQFEDVPPGTHTLDVVAIGLAFPQYRVEVSEKGSDRIVVSMNTDPNKVGPPPPPFLPPSFSIQRRREKLTRPFLTHTRARTPLFCSSGPEESSQGQSIGHGLLL